MNDYGSPPLLPILYIKKNLLYDNNNYDYFSSFSVFCSIDSFFRGINICMQMSTTIAIH